MTNSTIRVELKNANTDEISPRTTLNNKILDIIEDARTS